MVQVKRPVWAAVLLSRKLPGSVLEEVRTEGRHGFGADATVAPMTRKVWTIPEPELPVIDLQSVVPVVP